MAYAGTQETERILRVGRGKITIGVDPNESNLGTAEIRLAIDDADRFINSELSSVKDALPVSPTPDGLNFASKYLAAYFVHTMLFAANKPGKQSEVVESWKLMAKKTIKNYINNVETVGRPLKWTGGVDRAFTERGVDGVLFGDREGIFLDEDILDETE